MIEPFPDNRARLFGREREIHHLVDRAAGHGITAVAARPLMGKTWALTEVARRLVEQGSYLVGYHESKGGESSHLLYAVANLYERWLAEAPLRTQAISLWERHKDGLVPRIGEMAGKLFEKLGTTAAPAAVTSAVRGAFDWLVEAQKDLESGGLQLAPLPYDQALSLTQLVAKVSRRRIVLMLDAWEKSPSLRTEPVTLEGILKHDEDWSNVHVFLGVRNPEVNSADVNNDAYRQAQNICDSSGAGELYELPPMSWGVPKEKERMLAFVRAQFPAAKNQSDKEVLDAIDGYPGVFNFWTTAQRSPRRAWKDLERRATDAHALRYKDLTVLLNKLPSELRPLAARIALFPRLDGATWLLFRELLLSKQPDTDVDKLVDLGVLVDEPFPTYGHDTRHAEARRWFAAKHPALARRTVSTHLEALAAHVSGVNSDSWPYVEALVGSSATAKEVTVDATLLTLIDAARATIGELSGVLDRSFDKAYGAVLQRNASFGALISAALYNRGAFKSDEGDTQGAIADFTTVVGLAAAPPDMIANALLGRGIAKVIDDEAAAEADFTAVIGAPGTPAAEMAMALQNRGVLKGERGDDRGAIADFTAIESLAGASPTHVAQAILSRAIVKGQSGDFTGALHDYTSVVGMADAPPELVGKALNGRGARKALLQDITGAAGDFTLAISLPHVPPSELAKALNNRAIISGRAGDRSGAIADYTAAIELAGAPRDIVALAKKNLAKLRGTK